MTIAKHLIYYLLIVIILSFSSCFVKNDVGKPCESGCTTIKGKITSEENSLVPVGQVNYEFNFYSRPSGIGGGWLRRKIAKGTTDNEGKFEIQFYASDDELSEIQEGGHYELYYWKDGYVHLYKNVEKSYNDLSFREEIKRNITLNSNIHLASETKVNIKVENYQPVNPNTDFAYVECCFSMSGILNTNSMCYPYRLDETNGINQGFTAIMASNQRNILKFYGKKDGIDFVKIDTIFLNKGRDYNFTFKY